MMSTIYKIQPIILTGGQGTRLWPVSTPKIPKQFIPLGKKGTLLEETIRRVSLIKKHCEGTNYSVQDPLLVMHHTHTLPPFLAHHESNVIYEPYANGTAVAIGRALREVMNRFKDEFDTMIILVFPSDHYIYDTDAFVKDIMEGITHLTHDNIVLYGINPTAPESKYGYIIPSSTGIKFVEKPDKVTASRLIGQNALWNSGILAANAKLLSKCLYITPSYGDLMYYVFIPREGNMPSFDVAVLQEYSNIYAHYCHDWQWNDVGTWDSFTNIPEIQEEMEAAQNTIVSESNNVKVLNRGHGKIVLIGCDDLLVAANGSDILIMSNKDNHDNKLREIATRIGMNSNMN